MYASDPEIILKLKPPGVREHSSPKARTLEVRYSSRWLAVVGMIAIQLLVGFYFLIASEDEKNIPEFGAFVGIFTAVLYVVGMGKMWIYARGLYRISLRRGYLVLDSPRMFWGREKRQLPLLQIDKINLKALDPYHAKGRVSMRREANAFPLNTVLFRMKSGKSIALGDRLSQRQAQYVAVWVQAQIQSHRKAQAEAT